MMCLLQKWWILLCDEYYSIQYGILLLVYSVLWGFHPVGQLVASLSGLDVTRRTNTIPGSQGYLFWIFIYIYIPIYSLWCSWVIVLLIRRTWSSWRTYHYFSWCSKHRICGGRVWQADEICFKCSKVIVNDYLICSRVSVVYL